jgi:hypothetical protein
MNYRIIVRFAILLAIAIQIVTLIHGAYLIVWIPGMIITIFSSIKAWRFTLK